MPYPERDRSGMTIGRALVVRADAMRNARQDENSGETCLPLNDEPGAMIVGDIGRAEGVIL
ncbi:hypothetical protein DES45_105215 [Microvirga subterranea]|uniref:Uncharacterized protein n=1 Tax=Microvirga subterranea TaxID=186651 RepID=A0A370HJD3_9HYPH|nr:hypothetical protein DES45_105215 [Microvirga subterranea]